MNVIQVRSRFRDYVNVMQVRSRFRDYVNVVQVRSSFKDYVNVIQVRSIIKDYVNVIQVQSWHQCSRIRWFRAYIFYMSNAKSLEKGKMETTAMWVLTIIILKDIKCFQIWDYFEGLISFNFENFLYKIFHLFILKAIQSMHARYHQML